MRVYSKLAYVFLTTIIRHICFIWSSNVDICPDKTYFSHIVDGCAECPRHSEGCTARLSKKTQNNCSTSCQPYFPRESPSNNKSWTDDTGLVIAVWVVVPAVLITLILMAVCMYRRHRHRKSVGEQPIKEEQEPNYKLSYPGEKPIRKDTGPRELHNIV